MNAIASQTLTFLRVEEVAEILGVSKSYAYKVCSRIMRLRRKTLLNDELKEKGFLTISGSARENASLISLTRLILWSGSTQHLRKGRITFGYSTKMAVYKDGDKWRAVYQRFARSA